MRDFSEYLSLPNKLEIEESNWLANPHLHIRQAKVVNNVCEKYGLKRVAEIGCATGNFVHYLRKDLQYVGIDKNEEAIKKAKAKNNVDSFLIGDIRKGIEVGFNNQDWTEIYKPDIVCCFAFLKHFGLHEWQMIFEKCASLGEYFIFDMQIADETKDDGIEFHHVWKSVDGLNKSIYDAGLTLIERIEGDPVAPIFVCKKKKK